MRTATSATPATTTAQAVARRSFLLASGAVAWHLAGNTTAPAPGAAALHGSARARRRPNVLWIITDDQPRRSLRHMPHTMRLIADQGLTFTNGYAAVPWCGPARASILTSLYPHNHRCLTNNTHKRFVRRRLDADTVATRMKAAGYTTGYFGKYMNGNATTPGYVAPGWDRWVVRFTKRTSYAVDGEERRVSSNPVKAEAFAATQCQAFIRGHADDGRPWFAVFAPTAPHRPYTPSREHLHDFDDVAWDPPAFNERSMRDKAEFLQGLPTKNRDDMRRIWEGKLEELRDLDDQIRNLMQVLRRTRQLRRTFIILVSDNGYLLGEHRLAHKEYPYEEATGIPFLVRGPGIRRGKCAALVSQVDLMPTTLELVGADPDAGRPLEGRSMAAGLRTGDWSAWRNRLYIENPNLGWSMLREGHHSFVDYYTRDETELYNLRLDPFQLRARSGGRRSRRLRVKAQAMRAASGMQLRNLET